MVFGSARGFLSLLALLLALGVSSCGGGGSRSVEPRLLAVHNALTASGFTKSERLSEGSLPAGAEARVPLELEAGRCYTVVALGGRGVRDVALSLVDEQGQVLGAERTYDPEAAAQVCPESDGPFEAVVGMADGAGGYLLALWTGEAKAGGAADASSLRGDCAQPYPLAFDRETKGDTRGGRSELQGSCAHGDAPERVYAFEVEERSLVRVRLHSRFDAALYIIEQCATPRSELVCNDDEGGTDRSQLEATLDPGRYLLVVDGYKDQAGGFELSMTRSRAASPQDVCDEAPLLPVGQTVQGTTRGAADTFHAACAGGAKSPDRVFEVVVPDDSRLRVVQHSRYDAALYLRRVCDDESTEMACNDDVQRSKYSLLRAVLSPGTYYLFSDGYGRSEAGDFLLKAELAPTVASGTAADDCHSAEPVAGGRPVSFDTFTASDDLRGSCGGDEAPDVVYRLDVSRRSRLRASLQRSQFPGVMYLQRRCGDAGSELVCAPFSTNQHSSILDTVVEPGRYFLVVDGKEPFAFGTARLKVKLDDLADAERACRTAPWLKPGKSRRGNTTRSSDRFQASCGRGANSHDDVYRVRVRRRSDITVMVEAQYDAVVHLRSRCVDINTEIACNDDRGSNRRSSIEQTIAPGTYFVIIDGFRTGSQGSYSVDLELTPR